MLDLWADLGKIELEGTTLRIPAEKVTFQLTPAVRFLSLLEGQDTNKLLQKVKPESFVREIGGEVVTDSCLVGETAYQVQPGFLAEGEALAAAQASKATRKPAMKGAEGPAAGAPSIPPVPKSAQQPRTAPAAAGPAAAKAATPAAPARSAPGAAPAKTEDADLLTRFLLDSLE